MRRVRVYAPNGDVLRDLTDVSSGTVLANGTLTILMTTDPTNRHPGMKAVSIARGSWGLVEEWIPGPDFDGPPISTPAPAPAPAPGPLGIGHRAVPPASSSVGPAPSIPGNTVGIIPDPLAMSDAWRLREALQVVCMCEQLRQADPGRQPWPYGIHNHHPECPRHPDVYNRHTGPCGHSDTADGVPIIGTACVLPWGHDGKHNSEQPTRGDVTEGQPTPAGITAHAATRAVATVLRSAGLVGMAATVENAAGAALTGTVVAAAPVPEPADDQEPDWFRDRTIGQPCGLPEATGTALTCERPAGHDQRHAAFSGGGLFQW